MINERLMIPPETKKLCKDLVCVFCYIIFFVSGYVIIFLGIINDEINNGTATIGLGV